MIFKAFAKRGAQCAITASASQLEIAASAPAHHIASAKPFVTIGLILGLCAIFALELHYARDVASDYKISGRSLAIFGAVGHDLVVRVRQPGRLFLAPLLHLSAKHLIFNCIALLLIGVRLESLIGRGWFSAIFAASALGGGVGTVFGGPHNIASVGASGAIMGLVAALLAISFHHSVDFERRKLMRRRALVFAVPTLLPLFDSAPAHIDYSAHFGGAIVGGCLGLALLGTWRSKAPRPPGAAWAAGAALLTLAISIASAWFAEARYRTFTAEAQEIIPSALLEGAARDVAKRAPELMANYPSDPRGRFYLAWGEIDQGRLAEAEAQLRIAMTQAWPQRPSMEGAEHILAQTLLAIVLQGEGRSGEALQMAQLPCRAGPALDVRPALIAHGLCKDAASTQRRASSEFARNPGKTPALTASPSAR